MSVQEQRWWSYALIALVVPAVYFAIVIPDALGRPVTEIAYAVPLLVAGGTGVILSIIANIVLNISSAMRLPKGAPLKDERDRDINRLGEYVAGIVLAAAMAVPFGLTLLEAAHFWIANTMYLAFVLSAVAGSVVKILSYRRGF